MSIKGKIPGASLTDVHSEAYKIDRLVQARCARLQKQCRKRHKHQIPVSLDGFEEAANASEYIVHCIRQRLKEAPKDPLTINVAGQRASKCPGIHDDVRSIMYGVIHRLITGE